MKNKNLLTILLILIAKGLIAQPFSVLQKGLTITNTENNYAPLKSAAKDGLGPLALPYLRNSLMGSAYVFKSRQPDLFVCGNTRTSDLYLFKWIKNDDNGVPVFDTPLRINDFFTGTGTVFQTSDNIIHGLWLDTDSVIHTIFSVEKLRFIIKEKVKLPTLPGKVNSLAAYPVKEGGVDLILELQGLRIPPKYKNQNASSENWRPYDEAGISSAGFSYSYLYKIHYSQFLGGLPQKMRQVSPTNKEVLYKMMNLTSVNLVAGHANDLITGSFLGIFPFYKNSEKNTAFSERKYMVGEDGNILRHPSVSASVCAYPESKNGITNIIAGGEGAVYFYRFTGKFTNDGSPIFKEPTPVLQENADLYPGTLPVPTVVDWNGDGMSDLVVGNSEGFVLFFENIGNNDHPSFLPGTRIYAGGKEIQIQAEYSGSVQGTQESRWGYLSPTVVDWTGDGLPDIIMGDITGNYTIYINRGTKKKPVLDDPKPLYCEGLQLHGMWRSRAAVGNFNGRTAMAVVDGEDQFHLYWKIDDFNVKDGGKLLLEDGSPIFTSAEPAGGTGRCKLDFFDYDGDGKLDLIIGNGRRSAIPNMENGYPLPVLGDKTLGTPLFMRNVGTDSVPVFEHPFPFRLQGVGLLQPGGSHESGAIGTSLGGGTKRNLIVGNEVGNLYLLQGDQLSLMPQEEAKKYRNKPNPLNHPNPIDNSNDTTVALTTSDTISPKVIIEPTEANVHYGDHEREVLDFYQARSDKPTPLIIWIHGGGWAAGDKKNVPDLETYLEAGISVVSINYRYTWQAQRAGIMPPVKWPIDDAVRALQFVRSKSEVWNIDKKLIAASGSSAGATSSLYLAFHDNLADPKSSDPVARESSRLFCAGVRHPQTSLDPQQMIEWTPNSHYGGHAFGFTNAEDPKLRDSFFDEFLKNRSAVLKWIKMYSPYELVSKDDPGIYMYYPLSPPAIGQPQKDPTHTPNFGVKLKEHCDEVGVKCELVYPGLENVVHKSIADYLIQKLTNPGK